MLYDTVTLVFTLISYFPLWFYLFLFPLTIGFLIAQWPSVLFLFKS